MDDDPGLLILVILDGEGHGFAGAPVGEAVGVDEAEGAGVDGSSA
jgi:hypothetical protein